MNDLKLSYLFTPLSAIPGIGPKKCEDYKRLGCSNVRDLIFHFPINFVDRSAMPSLKHVANGQIITQKLTVDLHIPPPTFKGRRPYRVVCHNDTGKIELVYFNAYRQYLQRSLPTGAEIIVSGKVEYQHGNLQMVHPDFAVPANQSAKIPKVESVYPLTFKLTNRMVSSTIQHIVDGIPNVEEWYPRHLLHQKGWETWANSIKKIHFVDGHKSLLPTSIYRERLAFDELVAQQLSIMVARAYHGKSKKSPLHFMGGLKKELLKNLPFELTEGQLNAICEIEADQKSDIRMMRLLQGDVGCGKTLVALSVALNAVECGKQVAIMVPTEILANQHFSKITELCKSLNVSTELLLGKQTTKRRKAAIARITSGEASIVIGTHALFQDGIEFQDLGLIIIDEQHRFGVEQRLMIANKSKEADFLMMTATPIPRTLSMVSYGDMELSIIRQKPSCRIPITTSMLSTKNIETLADRIKSLTKAGEKIYWICPLIEESEALDLANINDRFEFLKKYLGDNVGIVHGKMKQAEREVVMQNFVNGKFQVLLATTVIEVGVDVPDATVIVIENAERFGLSQLHQLRGRVGRSDKKSYCILLYKDHISNDSYQRLSVIKNSNDGFEIAEADMKIRGTGQVLGTRQSGVPEYKTADFDFHTYLLKDAHELSKQVLQDDPRLEKAQNQNYKLLLQIYDFDKCLKYMKYN
jgi:ATP-dependent DNA helicase RecG